MNTFPDSSAFPNNPLTTTMPSSAASFLMAPGSALDMSDPLAGMFMGASAFTASNPYNFPHPAQGAGLAQPVNMKSAGYGGTSSFPPSFDGLNSTLAPPALDISQGQADWLKNYDAMFGNKAMEAPSRVDGEQGIALNDGVTSTPGVNGESWTSFIEAGEWEMPTASQ